MARRVVVVSATPDYVRGLLPLVRSFDHYHAGCELHVLAYGLDAATLHGVCRNNALNVIPKVVDRDQLRGHSQVDRYSYAAELADATVLLCDADMFFCANTDLLWRIAEGGTIVAGGNGMCIRYGADYAKQLRLDIPESYTGICMTSTPTWLRPDLHGELWARVGAYRLDGRFACDFTIQNVMLHILGKSNDVLMLPPQQMTNIHHFQLKPNTRVREVAGKLMTEDALPVYMSHGKWWDQAYRNDLIATMTRFAEGDERIVRGAKESAALLYRAFQQWT